MGKKISDPGGGSFAPTADIRQTGAMVKGALQPFRSVATVYGHRPLGVLKVVDAECKFYVGKEKTEAFPEAGDIVEFFMPTSLGRQLEQVPAGRIVTIKCLGRGKATKGQPPYLYEVILED